MKRKNELLHSLYGGSAKDPTVAKILKTVKDFPEDRQLTQLERDSVNRCGLFELLEYEDEDRLGMSGVVLFISANLLFFSFSAVDLSRQGGSGLQVDNNLFF